MENKEIKRDIATFTDYVIIADGEILWTWPTLREARLSIKEIGKAGLNPQLVELVKRTTTQKVLNVYKAKKVETLVATGLDYA